MFMMLLLVLGANYMVMFVGWEGVGLCSYLLIGFYYDKTFAADAGKKAFITNRIGDFGFLLGIFLIFNTFGSADYATVFARAAAGGAGQYGGIATAICILLFIGACGKSAQVPLYVWLPDAMAGPTPVSALIHAATMVTAGIYLVVRLSNVFLMSPTAMAIIAMIGAATALFAASIALVQTQMKKILAYSTVSQLGFMFAAVGVGAFAGGFFHVFTHAFFKACLFLGAGSVMHAVHAHGDADIRELGGMKKFMPITRWTFLISCFAIAGFPLSSGFFWKDDILLGAAYMGTGLWADVPR
jgi:NADH-quinone oxidoreductase subunit L